jgi:hypothetical protein
MFVCLLCAGILSCLDGYMNIALEQTEKHVNGVVTNRYGDMFIHGNNGKSFKDVYMVGCVLMCHFIQVLYISAAELL